MDKIKIKSFDEGANASIRISCNRETSRLDRVLQTFQKAMTLAQDGRHLEEFKRDLEGLHDHKGQLSITWRSAARFPTLRSYVDDAWRDEGECVVTHELVDRDLLSGESEILP